MPRRLVACSDLAKCDFTLADWQTSCWGEHAARLAVIKKRYDPADPFIVHHGVGSERWTTDGFAKTT